MEEWSKVWQLCSTVLITFNICKGRRGRDEMKLSIHPSRQLFRPSLHPSSSSHKKKMMEEEEDDEEWRQQQFI